MPHLGPYAVLMLGVILVVTGLIAAALGVGWWGRRTALKHGRACSVCGFWGTELEMLAHDCTYKPDVRKRDETP